MRPRYSIGGLLLLIVVCGVGFAALRSPTPLWGNILCTAAAVALMTAVAQIIYARGARRRFWTGFAICGGGYFAMCFVPPFREDLCLRLVTTPILEILYEKTVPTGPTSISLTPMIAAPAPSSIVVADAISVISQDPANPGNVYQPIPGAPISPVTLSYTIGLTTGGSQLGVWDAWTRVDANDGTGLTLGNVALVTTIHYRRIGHSLFALLFGLIGGLASRRAFDDGDRPTRPEIP